MLKEIQNCFHQNEVLYSKHAKTKMETEESGILKEEEVAQAVISGKIINEYLDDDPYPSCLIYGKSKMNRPLHIVSAYSNEEDIVIIVTVYEPDPKNGLISKGGKHEMYHL